MKSFRSPVTRDNHISLLSKFCNNFAASSNYSTNKDNLNKQILQHKNNKSTCMSVPTERSFTTVSNIASIPFWHKSLSSPLRPPSRVLIFAFSEPPLNSTIMSFFGWAISSPLSLDSKVCSGETFVGLFGDISPISPEAESSLFLLFGFHILTEMQQCTDEKNTQTSPEVGF